MSDPVLASTRFTVTRADVTAANRTYLRWTLRHGRTWAYLAGIALVCMLGFAVMVPNGRTSGVLAGVAGGVIAWMLAWYALVYVSIPLFARRAMTSQPNLLHEWHVELSAHGMRAMTPNQDNFVAWPDYVAWAEDANVLLLYQGDRLFQFVPKRGLEPGFMDVVRRFTAGKPKR